MNLWRTVPGALMSLTEREWLRRVAASIAIEFPSPMILNIGVYKGASMHCLRAGAPNATLVGIDVASYTLLAPNILRAEILLGDSRKFGPKWRRPIHLLFIDGGHSYEVVRTDILNFGKHVVLGGVIAFHDYARTAKFLAARRKRHPKRPPLGVKKAVDELCTPQQGWMPLLGVDSIGAFRRVL